MMMLKIKDIHWKLSEVEGQSEDVKENLCQLVERNLWCKEDHVFSYLVQYQKKV